MINAKGEVKLCDFGASSINTSADTFTGSPCWMAPEVWPTFSFELSLLSGSFSFFFFVFFYFFFCSSKVIQILDSGPQYTQKADIWSFAILCLELAEGKPPHFGLDAMQACFSVMSNPPPKLKGPKWSADFHSMLAKCLIKEDATKRPTVEELLQVLYFFLVSFFPFFLLFLTFFVIGLQEPFIKKSEPMLLKRLLRQSRSMSSSRLLQKPKPPPPAPLEDVDEKSEKAESVKDMKLDVASLLAFFHDTRLQGVNP